MTQRRRQTTAPEDQFVSTFWFSDADREAGRRPIMHVYGPYTYSRARRIKREFDAVEPPDPGLFSSAICKPINVE
jgi:hypothetical protein